MMLQFMCSQRIRLPEQCQRIHGLQLIACRAAAGRGVALKPSAAPARAGAGNDWHKDRQFRKLNQQKETFEVKVVRNGKEQLLTNHDVVVGDVLVLDTGDKVRALAVGRGRRLQLELVAGRMQCLGHTYSLVNRELLPHELKRAQSQSWFR